MNAQNQRGESPLHVAISSPNTLNPANLVKRLLLKGADTSLKNKKDKTVLDLANKRYKRDPSMLSLVRCVERATGTNQSCFARLKEKFMI